MSDRRTPQERVEQVLIDLLKSHAQLMKGIGAIVVDYKLVNEAPLHARRLLEDIRMGKVHITRWADLVHGDDDEEELENTFG